MLLYGSHLIYRADAFAEIAHEGQVRKYTNDPYIVHPRQVASYVQNFCVVDVTPGQLEVMTAAALLHDTVEDCGVSIDEIYDRFNNYVGDIVNGLTDKSIPSDGSRIVRKLIDMENLAAESSMTQMVKCADLIDNTRSIVISDPDFAHVYLREKAELLRAMDSCKGTLIRAMAKASVKWGNNRLGYKKPSIVK